MDVRKSIACHLLILCLVPTSLAGFTEQLERIEPAEGVVTSIEHIFQERSGFLWLSTSIGLVRYDGKVFRTYKNKPGNPRTISNDRVTVFYQDGDDHTWMGTRKGLSIYDPVEDRFWRVHNGNDDEDPLRGKITGIVEAKDDRVWITTDRGLVILDPDTLDWEYHIPNEENEESTANRLTDIKRDGSGKIWIGSAQGLLTFDPETKRFSRVNVVSLMGRDTFIHKLYVDRENNLWAILGRDRILFRLEPMFQKLLPFVMPGNPDQEQFQVTSIMQDRQKRYWFGTQNNGIWRYDNPNNIWRQFKYEAGNARSLTLGKVNAILQDQGDVIWAGTRAGLTRILPAAANFNHVQVNEDQPEVLSDNRVRSILRDRNKGLWIATEKGIDYKSADNRHIHHQLGPAIEVPYILGEHRGGANVVAEDAKGRIWAGSNRGLHLFKPERERFSSNILERLIPRRLSKVNHIVADREGGIWLAGGFDKGIVYFHYDKKQLKRHRPDPKRSDAFAGGHVTAMYLDRSNNLWIGANGLNRRDPKTGRFTVYRHDPENGNSPSNNYVSGIAEDSRGNLWFTTEVGLNRYSSETGIFIRFYEEDGLPSLNLYGLVCDAGDYLWISHGSGLTRFFPETREAVNFDLNDGLNNFFEWGVYHAASDGELFFGGSNGYNHFYPEKIRQNPYTPPVHLTSFKTYQKYLTLADALSLGEALELDEDRAFIKLEFAALDFSSPDKNLYSYKLEGRDKDWSIPSTMNWKEYSRLPAGTYRFRVRGTNNNGKWSEAEQELYFTIVPPFWRTQQAYLLYALLIPTLLFLFYRLRVRRLRARARELEGLVEQRTESLRQEKEKTEEQARKLVEMDRLKTQFFANVSHEFRTPLTLIIGPLESMLAEGADLSGRKLLPRFQTMLRNGRRLLRLINQILDVSKLEAGKMRLFASERDLVRFVRTSVFAFQSLADTRGLRLTFESDAEQLPIYFDGEKLEKVLFNLIGNAFQFTESGEIAVKIRVTDETVVLCVRDTGTGISERDLPYIFDRFRQADGSMTRETEGTGIGLSLVRELIALHHGQVELSSQKGKGTEFRVTLHRGRAHLSNEEIAAGLDPDQFRPDAAARIEMAHLRTDDPVAATVHDGTSSATGETLLVVDDHPDIREYILDALSDQFRMIVAVDGQEGLEKARAFKPDLIISDVMMPRMDGYEMCRQIRRDASIDHIPIIMLTAKASDEMKVEGLEIGANDYLSKPFNVRELSARVRNLLHIREQERSVKKSLEMAHKAQISMLPQEVPTFDGLDIATFSRPAREVGGDYYDFILRDPHKLGVVIGDVSGKGMPAALYMTMAKGLMQACSQSADSPCEALCRINRQFHRASSANTFISLQYAIIDPQARKMVFSNAGHNPLILCRNGEEKAQLLKSPGMAIGLEGGRMFDRIVQDEGIEIQPGDTLVFYTDGFVEGMNDASESFGESRLLTLIEQSRDLAAADLIGTITREYDRFVGGAEPFDDMTAVVVKIPQAA